MDRKTFVYKDSFGDEYNVALVLNMYNDNNNLYIGLEAYDEEYDYWDPYCDLTVNVGKLPFLESAINIEFFSQEKVAFLVQNGFGELTDKKLRSAFVEFPVFKFNAEKLKELDPIFFAEYARENGRSVDELIQDAKNKAENSACKDSDVKNKDVDIER